MLRLAQPDNSIVFYDVKESARKVTKPAQANDSKKTSPRDTNQMKYRPVMHFGEYEQPRHVRNQTSTALTHEMAVHLSEAQYRTVNQTVTHTGDTIKNKAPVHTPFMYI